LFNRRSSFDTCLGLLYFDLMTAASAAAAACGALLLFLFYWLYERNMKL